MVPKRESMAPVLAHHKTSFITSSVPSAVKGSSGAEAEQPLCSRVSPLVTDKMETVMRNKNILHEMTTLSLTGLFQSSGGRWQTPDRQARKLNLVTAEY